MNTKLCEKCGKGEAVVNLSTPKQVEGGDPGPELWVCAECFGEGVNSPEARALAEADEEAEKHRRGDGRLS